MALFQLLQPPRLRHRHPCVLRLPVIEGRFRDPVSAAQLFGFRASFRLLQHRNFCSSENLLPFMVCSSRGQDSTPAQTTLGCQVAAAK
jgi:hypothetical protein